MTKIRVACLDPSFSNFGMVKGTLDLNTNAFHPEVLALTETSSDSSKKSVRKNSQDLDRWRIVANNLESFLRGVQLVFVEVPHGSQSARAMVSYGGCVALLATIKQPLIQVNADEVKRVVGTKNPTKQAMCDWAYSQYPFAPWLSHNGKRVLKNEHLADAIAALHAGLLTDQYKGMAQVLRSAHEVHTD